MTGRSAIEQAIAGIEDVKASLSLLLRPETSEQQVGLVEGAPENLADLIPWFEGLSSKQLNLCWVAAVVWAVNQEMVQDRRINLHALSLCLAAVRDRCAGGTPPEPTAPTLTADTPAATQTAPAAETACAVGMPTPPTTIKSRPKRPPGAQLAEAIEMLEARCPNVGDAVQASELIADINQRYKLVEWCRANEGSAQNWAMQARKSATPRPGKVPLWFVRVGPRP